MRAAYRAFFALLTLTAVFVQVLHGLGRPAFSPANFFSYFTIESNIFAALVFLAALVLVSKDHEIGTFAIIRGAAVLCMVTTGIVDVLLLSSLEQALQTPIPWVNLVLHYIMPLAVAADWLVDPPRERITIDRAVVWLAFPAVYFVYSLVRGHVLGWYPYPFLNPEQAGGYGGVALYAMAITIGLAVLMGLMVWAARRRATSPPAHDGIWPESPP